jgi:hypothetical protein
MENWRTGRTRNRALDQVPICKATYGFIVAPLVIWLALWRTQPATVLSDRPRLDRFAHAVGIVFSCSFVDRFLIAFLKLKVAL